MRAFMHAGEVYWERNNGEAFRVLRVEASRHFGVLNFRIHVITFHLFDDGEEGQDALKTVEASPWFFNYTPKNDDDSLEAFRDLWSFLPPEAKSFR